ncbi:hypothetical protein GUY44_06945 [Pimelobacter simplex]|uniref:hypothetical protein n=1 Tax=Nocardioides simplex TaxID=2045 RepID=UPI000535E608|nr:hypothetical protein [Pimelobacter simplex]MCG8150208.1 hypothetical protein [Pimelobacter simplex]GEB13582.1 hypothetical protein NSI01_18970 [Pimelobacter simplex]SFM71405.1 hypothetical protein SAMN05421671_3089 [Pimelobacter simplex]
MSTSNVNPEWDDDLLAIAEAVGVTARQHPELSVVHTPHPALREEFTNLALELTLGAWSDEVLADLPVALLPTDHEDCGGCGEVLCGCINQCDGLERDVCSHDGRQYCPGCAAHHCVYCRADEDRWGRC